MQSSSYLLNKRTFYEYNLQQIQDNLLYVYLPFLKDIQLYYIDTTATCYSLLFNVCTNRCYGSWKNQIQTVVMLDSIVDSCRQNCCCCHWNCYRCLLHCGALLSFGGQQQQIDDAYWLRYYWTLFESRGCVIHHLLLRLSNSMDYCSWFFVD